LPDVLTLLQLGFSAALLGAIIERANFLLLTAPLSRRGLDFVLRALERAEVDALRAFADGTSRTHVGRVLRLAFTPGASESEFCSRAEPRASTSRAVSASSENSEAALAELSFDLAAEAIARLRALRVGATIASTLGLLIGIVRLRGGFSEPPGLLALEAGLTERLAVADALLSMAIGVGSSAVCFYALSVLGRAAQGLITQRARVENALRAHAH
jgi:hypothetical protein